MKTKRITLSNQTVTGKHRLPKDESPQVLHIGGQVRGFVYENEDHQLQMTCKHIPTVQVDHYDYGTVVSVRRDLGVFVDIGLPNKDIAVSVATTGRSASPCTSSG